MSNEIVAGIDIHKDFLVVTVLRGEEDRFTKEYGTGYQSLLHFKRWLARLKVSRVAIEATGVYMIQCVELLKDRFEVYLVNAADTRHIPGKKTDAIDSKWLALLLSKNLLKKSHIPTRLWREIRELVRQRIAQTQTRTRVKNRLHKVLVQEGFYISRAFSDICGTTSLLFITGLMKGKSLSEVVDQYPQRRFVLRALPELQQYNPMRKRLSKNVSLLLKLLLNEIEQCNLRIEILEDRVLHLTQVDAQCGEGRS